MADEESVRSDLLDVSGISLDELGDLPECALVEALRRVLAAGDEDVDYFAAFQNSL